MGRKTGSVLYMGSAGWEPTELNSGYFSAAQRGLKGNKIAGAGERVKKKKKKTKRAEFE